MTDYLWGLAVGLWIGTAVGFAAALWWLTRPRDFDQHADGALQFNEPTFEEASDEQIHGELTPTKYPPMPDPERRPR